MRLAGGEAVGDMGARKELASSSPCWRYLWVPHPRALQPWKRGKGFGPGMSLGKEFWSERSRLLSSSEFGGADPFTGAGELAHSAECLRTEKNLI